MYDDKTYGRILNRAYLLLLINNSFQLHVFSCFSRLFVCGYAAYLIDDVRCVSCGIECLITFLSLRNL